MRVADSAFPRTARLRKPAEFKAVLSAGRRVPEPPLTAVLTAAAAGRARIGFAISARSVPRAVDRNRIKRQARETFRQQALPPLDIVILARPGAGQTKSRELRQLFDRLWKKIRASYPPAS